VYADATGANQHTTGTSDLEILKKCFRGGSYGEVTFKIPQVNPAVRDRVMLVNAKLRPAEGERMLWVDPRCGELIKDLEQVAYKEGSQVVDKDRDPRRTHLSDALGYLVWQEFREQLKVGERDRRLM
jgi:hypothetical protein